MRHCIHLCAFVVLAVFAVPALPCRLLWEPPLRIEDTTVAVEGVVSGYIVDHDAVSGAELHGVSIILDKVTGAQVSKKELIVFQFALHSDCSRSAAGMATLKCRFPLGSRVSAVGQVDSSGSRLETDMAFADLARVPPERKLTGDGYLDFGEFRHLLMQDTQDVTHWHIYEEYEYIRLLHGLYNSSAGPDRVRLLELAANSSILRSRHAIERKDFKALLETFEVDDSEKRRLLAVYIDLVFPSD